MSNYTEQSHSWEANRSSDSQEIPRFLWDPEIYYRIHKSLPTVPTLSYTIPLQTSHPISWRSILILCSQLHQGLPSGFPSLRFPHQNLVCTSPLISSITATCPAHLILLNLISRIIYTCSFTHPTTHYTYHTYIHAHL